MMLEVGQCVMFWGATVLWVIYFWLKPPPGSNAGKHVDDRSRDPGSLSGHGE